VLILDEADYKRLLSWSTKRFLGSQLVIEGPINVDISRNLLFSAGGITLQANDDSYRLPAGELRASGHSPHDLVSNLSGSASLGLENARIPNHYVKLLSLDVFGWVLSKSVSVNPYSNLNCVVVAFDISAGEVKSEALITDGPNLNIGGQINMNLGEETLDIVLLPTEKRRLFSSISPVHV